MGTFAQTAIHEYCSLFAERGTQTSVSIYSKQMKFTVPFFRLQQTNGSRHFA
jgi:hypothetical protein